MEFHLIIFGRNFFLEKISPFSSFLHDYIVSIFLSVLLLEESSDIMRTFGFSLLFNFPSIFFNETSSYLTIQDFLWELSCVFVRCFEWWIYGVIFWFLSCYFLWGSFMLFSWINWWSYEVSLGTIDSTDLTLWYLIGFWE